MEDRRDKQDAQRILLIKETIASAEKNLQTAKSLLSQLESKYTPQKKTYGVAEGGKIVEGSFDGQLMIGVDGRQYPVPANYASKSKLVEGDMLKLVITEDGNFIYKQIGPFKRKHLIGVLKESPKEGGYIVEAEGKEYKVLLAAVTYHHANPNDEIALVVADNDDATWGAIENVIKKGEVSMSQTEVSEALDADEEEETAKLENEELADSASAGKELTEETKKEKKIKKAKAGSQGSKETALQPEEEIVNEITPDLEEIEKELKN